MNLNDLGSALHRIDVCLLSFEATFQQARIVCEKLWGVAQILGDLKDVRK
jgi:hypothetical protein